MQIQCVCLLEQSLQAIWALLTRQPLYRLNNLIEGVLNKAWWQATAESSKKDGRFVSCFLHGIITGVPQ